jgi:3'(2'), 5'-bisphosphate nucleotidase
MILTESDFEYLVNTVDEASSEIMKIYDQKDFHYQVKTDGSPVTLADTLANQILIKLISLRWPKIPILSEESVNTFQLDEHPVIYWAIDPLDGTKEFIDRNGQFTVNVALIIEGQAQLGIIAAPAIETLYIGQLGGVLKKRSKNTWSKIKHLQNHCDLENRAARLKVAVSKSHPSPELHQWLNQYPLAEQLPIGSSLKLCWVAEGLADCYPRFGSTHIWDIAAGEAILKSVGGRILSWPLDNFRGLDYRTPYHSINSSFIAIA